MLSLHTNTAALNTKANLYGNQSQLATSMTRLGTGLRINSAMDDAAGLQIATRLDTQSRGMGVAMRNTQNAISMLQTAEGALDEASNITLRMKDLAIQAADDTSSDADKTAMKAEFTELGAELESIMKNTKFGGQALLEGGKLADKINFQVGAADTDKFAFDAKTEVAKVATEYAALKGGDISDSDGGNAAIKLADTALDAIGALRSKLGAGANRLDHIHNNLSNMVNNTTAAKGRIMDTDYAAETANMTKNQMLVQAGTSMLKQSGSMSSLAMSLLG